MRKVRRAAEPYSLSAAVAHAQTPTSVFLLPPALRVLPRSDEETGNVWLKGEDLADALTLAGMPTTEEQVDSALQQLRNFLPGIICGKFCLQELLAINEFIEGIRGTAPAASAAPAQTSKQALPSPKRRTVTLANPLSSSAEFKANETRMHQISHSTWKLPFRGKTSAISKAAIKEEFRRLDILGEGRINMLNLRSALELREVRESDETVREWFRATDRGDKGYIDFADYQAIYDSGSSKTLTFSDLRSSGERKSPADRATSPSSAKRKAEEERLALLRKAFERYDVDGDGKISSEDLRKAFTAQGKAFTPTDLRTWVQTRDLSGTGAVCFDDFAKHYK